MAIWEDVRDKHIFGKIAEDIATSGIVKPGERIEYDFDIDLAIKQANEITRLSRQNNAMLKRINYLTWKIDKLSHEKHVYKIEMNRLRRKLTRVYAYLEDWFDPRFDRLRNL